MQNRTAAGIESGCKEGCPLRKMSVVLTEIRNDHRISREQDAEFLKFLELGLLRALLQENRITEDQYRKATEILISRKNPSR